MVQLMSVGFTSVFLFVTSACTLPVQPVHASSKVKIAFDSIKKGAKDMKEISKLSADDEGYEEQKKNLGKLVSTENIYLTLKIINKPEVRISEYKRATQLGIAVIEDLKVNDLKRADHDIEGNFLNPCCLYTHTYPYIDAHEMFKTHTLFCCQRSYKLLKRKRQKQKEQL